MRVLLDGLTGQFVEQVLAGRQLLLRDPTANAAKGTTRSRVAAAQAASGGTALFQADRIHHRRGSRRCYRSAASGGTALFQADCIRRRRGSRRCYRSAGSGGTALFQADRIHRRRGSRRCYRSAASGGTGYRCRAPKLSRKKDGARPTVLRNATRKLSADANPQR